MLTTASMLHWGVSHCVKNVRIRSYSGPHFPAFGLNTENTDQNNSEYGHFSCSVSNDKKQRRKKQISFWILRTFLFTISLCLHKSWIASTAFLLATSNSHMLWQSLKHLNFPPVSALRVVNWISMVGLFFLSRDDFLINWILLLLFVLKSCKYHQ